MARTEDTKKKRRKASKTSTKRTNPQGTDEGRRKAAAKNTGRARTVTPEQYADMFDAYCEKPSARFVARQCNVTWSTANKVIEKGYPALAMPPLKERYRVAMQNANEKAEYRLADAHAQSLILIRGYKSKIAQKINKLDVDDLPAALGGELDRMIRLESLLLGGADSRPDLMSGGGDVYDGMTYDERIAFLRTGKLPEPSGTGAPGVGNGKEDEQE